MKFTSYFFAILYHFSFTEGLKYQFITPPFSDRLHYKNCGCFRGQCSGTPAKKSFRPTPSMKTQTHVFFGGVLTGHGGVAIIRKEAQAEGNRVLATNANKPGPISKHRNSATNHDESRRIAITPDKPQQLAKNRDKSQPLLQMPTTESGRQGLVDPDVGRGPPAPCSTRGRCGGAAQAPHGHVAHPGPRCPRYRP